MKTFLIPALLLMIIWSCNPARQSVKSTSEKKIVSDSTEYEITIIDNDFDMWYLQKASPATDHSNDFYRQWNQMGVRNWNEYFMHGRYHQVISDYINYNSTVDYGIEVNRKLYWYFKYVEEKYGVSVLK